MNTARGSLVEESALANALKVLQEILKRPSGENLKSVLWIRMFLGLPDPSLFCEDPDPGPSIQQTKKSKKNHRYLLFFVTFLTFYL